MDKKVTGTAEGNSLVYVKVGSTIIGRGKTDATGHFTVAVPAQTSGTKVSVVIKNSKGLYSSYTSKVVQ
ncbi:Ig-like domain-containing protein [Priestia flexa]|uniref:Ig-like domain-containing protein n=1 Tax=Priestia flexa TaxID=86664 RepID=UPI001B32B140